MRVLPYPSAPDRYLVAEDGRIYSIMSAYDRGHKAPKQLKPYICNGYQRVGITLRYRQKSKQISVHAIVCETFHGPKPTPKHECAHFDGDPLNNLASNLRWATSKENAQDRARHGRNMWGEKCHLGVLTDDKVRAIRILLAQGWSQSRIGTIFGVSPTSVSLIKTGQTWNHLEDVI